MYPHIVLILNITAAKVKEVHQSIRTKNTDYNVIFTVNRIVTKKIISPDLWRDDINLNTAFLEKLFDNMNVS